MKKLNYVIATHPDTDHIAGLDKVIKEFNIGSVYMPITNKDNKEVRELCNVLIDKEVINPASQDKFDLGNTNNIFEYYIKNIKEQKFVKLLKNSS